MCACIHLSTGAHRGQSLVGDVFHHQGPFYVLIPSIAQLGAGARGFC